MSQEFTITINARNNAGTAFRALAADARALGSTLKSVTGSGSGGGLSALSADAGRAQTALRGISSEAQRTASSLQRIGQTKLTSLGADAQQANAQLRNVGQSAQQADRGFAGLRSSGVEVGAAMGAVAAGLAKVGASALNQERQIAGLRAAYGEAVGEIERFADAIQSSTRFSDDAVRESALIAQSLAQNYDLTNDQIQTLIARSSDLAQVFGTDLADAVQRTSGAIRGEGEAAERLGLNMSDAAVAARALDAGITGWNVPGQLSEAEKAAFRFQVFIEDSTYALGQAAEFGGTAAGGFAQFVNSVQDAGQALGSVAGPAAAFAAQMAPIAIALPVVGAAAGRAAPAVVALGRALATVSMAAGPVGLVLGAIGAAIAVGAADMAKQNAAIDESVRQYRELSDALNEVRDAQSQGMFRDALTDIESSVGASERWGDQINELDADYEKLIATREAGARALGGEVDATDAARQVWDEYALTLPEVDSVNRDIVDSARDAGDEQQRVAGIVANLTEAHRNGSLEGGVFVNTMHTLSEALKYTGAGQEAVRNSALTMIDGFLSGRTSADQLNTGIIHLNDNMSVLGPAWAQMGQSVQRFTGEQLAAQTAMGMQGQAARLTAQAIAQQRAEYESTIPVTDRFSQLQKDAALAAFDQSMATSDAATGTERYAEAADAAAAVMADFDQRAQQMAGALSGTLLPGLAGAEGAFAAMVPAGNDMLDVLAAMEPAASASGDAFAGWRDMWADMGAGATQTVGTFTQVADGLNDAAQAADSAMTVIVQGTEQIGSRAGALDQYQQGLYNVADGTGRATDAVNAGTISWEQYAQQIDLSAASADTNWRAQDALTRIMLAQAPYVQQSAEAYADQVEQLALLPAEQQRYALALQDTGVQAKLAAVTSAQYAASIGEIPEEVATDIIVGAAQADPVIGDLLEQYGVIERGADGEITVNFPDGESVQSSMQGIEEAVNNLNNTIIQIAVEAADTEAEKQRLEDLKIAADDADGKTVALDVYADGAERARVDVEGTAEAAEAADGKSVNLDISAEGAEGARADLEGTAGAAAEIDGKTATIDVTANGGEGVAQQFDSIRGTVTELDGTTATASIELQGGENVYEAARRTADALSEATGQTYVVTIDSNGEAVIAEVEGLRAGVSGIDGQRATVGLDATDNATPVLTQAERSAALLDGRQVVIDVAARLAQGFDSIVSGARNLFGGGESAQTIEITATVNDDAVQQFIQNISNNADRTIDVSTSVDSSALDRVVADIGGLPRTMDVAVNVDSGALSSVASELDRLANKTVNVSVSTSGGASVPAEIAAALGRIPAQTTARVNVLAAGGASVPAEIAAALNRIPASTTASVGIAVQGNINEELLALAGALGEIGRTSVTASVGISTSGGAEIPAAIREALASIPPHTTANVSITATGADVPASAKASLDAVVGTYTATVAATDSASGPIAAAKGAADGFVGTYSADITAADSASGTIAGAQGSASAFATTYSAGLEASDNASGTIAAVSGALAALDGQTATTYINTVRTGEAGPGVAYALGGVVGPNDGIPIARDGRVVQVGEAGAELVTLPVGSMVHPHGASQSRMGAKERAGRLGPGVGAAGSADEMRQSFTTGLRGGAGEAAAAGEALGQAASDGLRRGSEPDVSLKLGREWAESYWMGALEQGAETAEGAAWLARRATRAADDEVAKALARLRGTQAQLRTARDEVQRTSAAFADAPSRPAMAEDVAARRAASRIETKVDDRRVDTADARAGDLKGQIADAKQDAKGADQGAERSAARDAVDALQKRLALTGQLSSAMRDVGRAGSAAEAEIAGFRVDTIRAKLDEVKGRAKQIGDFWGEQIAKANERATRTTDRASGRMGNDLAKVGEAGSAAASEISGSMESELGTAEEAIQQFGTSMDSAISDAAAVGTEQIEGVQESAEALGEEAPTVKVGADRGLFDRIWSDVMAKVNGLDATSAEVGIGADDQPLANAVNQIDGDTLGTAYIEVDYRDGNGDKPKKEGKRDGGQIRRGYAHGGAVLDPGWVPAANGRVVRVGEAGEEFVTLPYGAMVHPHGASRSMEAAGGGPGGPRYYIQTLVVQVPDGDVARQVERALAGR